MAILIWLNPSPQAIPVPDEAVPGILPDEAAPPSEGTLSLEWTNQEVDLDLHCWITLADGSREHLSHKRLEWKESAGSMRLDADIRHGGIAETLRWTINEPVTLEFAVHVYTENASFASADNPLLSATIGPNRFSMRPPPGPGRWWRTLSVQRDTPPVIISSLEQDEPYAN